MAANIQIIHGHNQPELAKLADNSIDSCVTDPPYGISFMNKHWDYDIPGVQLFQEIYRVLKPGGYIICACGTRTQHRMASKYRRCRLSNSGCDHLALRQRLP